MRRSSARLANKSTVVLPVGAGRIIGGKYDLVRRLGAGSMGEVWLARHRTLDENVALKLLSTAPHVGELEKPDVAAARFRFEAQIAARLSRRSRHIVRVTDHGEEGALAYLVMELLEGQTLEAHVMRRGRMTPARVSLLVGQITRGLEQAHSEGVVHRDLKPANIFLARDEDGADLVKLLDFGIARLMRGHRTSGTSTARHIVFGTPGYMSPEHALAVAEPDRHYDLWALATIAYEALTEELPVPGVSVNELLTNLRARRFVPIHERAPDLPPGLAAFFARAFSESVADRYASASDLAQALEQAIRERDALGTAGTGHRERRRHLQVAAAAAVIGLGLGLGATLAMRDKTSAVQAGRPGGLPSKAVEPSGGPGALPSTPVEPFESQAPGGDESMVAAGRALSVPPPPMGLTGLESAQGSEGGAPSQPSSFPSPPAGPSGLSMPGCVPPFETDAQGTKRWKRACL